jgi:hypothetical protein
MSAAIPKVLLPALVPKPNMGEVHRSHTIPPSDRENSRLHNVKRISDESRFGDNISIKSQNSKILRIGFQNIGGIPVQIPDIKEDNLRLGITNWDFDIFGIAETNIDWRTMPEDTKLWGRTREWWEHLHISYANNTTFPPISEKQFGGTAIFSLNDTAHRVFGKGYDDTLLGRWSWTTFKGKNNHLLTVIAAYRPNPPSAGVMGTYAQQAKYFNSIERDVCPREAFVIDLSNQIQKLQEAGHLIILMLDGNEDMRHGNLANSLTSLQLKEAILDKHGRHAPSTYRRNTKNVPIDGIWLSISLNITAGGYFAMD